MTHLPLDTPHQCTCASNLSTNPSPRHSSAKFSHDQRVKLLCFSVTLREQLFSSYFTHFSSSRSLPLPLFVTFSLRRTGKRYSFPGHPSTLRSCFNNHYPISQIILFPSKISLALNSINYFSCHQMLIYKVMSC